MKRWISVILLICIAILAVGCEKVTGAAATVYYEQTTPPVNVDPLLASTASEWVIVHHIFEPLFQIGKEGNVIPAAAKEVAITNGGLTYTIALRDDLLWSDDIPVTAHDFAFALKRALSPETKASCASQLMSIVGADAVLAGTSSAASLGVSVVDDHTLTLSLSKPDESLTATLSGPAGMPCREDFFESCGGRYGMGKDYVIAMGRFALTRWITAEKEEMVRLSKNKQYHAASGVKPSGIVMTFADAENRLFRLEKNDIDCGDLPRSMVEQATKEKLQTLTCGEDVYALVCNTDVNKATANVALRKALLGAVNRQTVHAYLPTYCVPAQSVMVSGQYYGATPYTSAGYQTDFENQYHSLFQTALSGLDADAVKHLTLCYTEQEGLRPAIDSLVQCWQKEFGVYVTLRPLSRWELSQAIASGDFDLAVSPMNNPQKSSLEVLQQFGDEQHAFAHFTDPAYVSLLATCQEASSGDLTAQRQCEQWLFQHAIVMPLYEVQSYYVTDQEVSGWQINPITRLPDFGEVLKF